ncbi:MAG: BlaI/MecI/CopY family transcriptional regulator [Chloroflexota bacterium]|nr:BlaI/MecI/CopY family transcriptional regulator [Chloroflexota bacterium]
MGLTTDYQLGELEEAVMEIIWRNGPEVTVREVWQALQPTRPLAYTTVMTVMSRLVPKGVLRVRRQGKADYYQPTGTREELKALQAQRAVQDVLAHFGDVGIAQFLRELQETDPEKLAHLRVLLNQESSDAS